MDGERLHTQNKKTVRVRVRCASCCDTVLFETTSIETNKTFVGPSSSFIGDTIPTRFAGRVDVRIRFVFNRYTSVRLRDSLSYIWGGGGWLLLSVDDYTYYEIVCSRVRQNTCISIYLLKFSSRSFRSTNVYTQSFLSLHPTSARTCTRFERDTINIL